MGAEYVLPEVLTRVDRHAAARDESARRCAPRTLRRVHTTGFGHRTLEDPWGQRMLAQGATSINVFLDHVGHLQPSSFLP